MKTILLLEDDENLNRGISLRLEKEGYRVLPAFHISQARRLFHENEVSLIISDIILPDGSGLDFGREVRKSSSVYLIFLTALNQEIDIVSGYDIGADDYITKPFSLIILLSKVNALMKRVETPAGCRLCSGDICLDYREMKVWQGDVPVELSKKEWLLLAYFMENPRQILTKEQLLDAVWGQDGQFVDDNTVPVNISRLRGKLGGDFIQNVRGMGYLWTNSVTKEF